MRRFQSYKDSHLVKRMFYNNLDQLKSIEEKISYLLMVLEDIDSERLNKYMVSSVYGYETQPETDTSVQQGMYDKQRYNKNMMNQSPIKDQRNSHPIPQSINPPNRSDSSNNKFTNINPIINNNNNINRQNTLLQHTKSQDNLTKYYSRSSFIDSTLTDQAIISSLYNSNQPHLYKDLVNMHRQRKSQAQLSSADSLIQNQKILHQLKKLQMQKQLQKYQNKSANLNHVNTNTNNKYSQSFSSPNYQVSPNYQESKNNQYPTKTKSYCNDFQQQNQSDSNSQLNYPKSCDNNDLLTRLQNKYQTNYLPNFNNKQNMQPKSNTKQQKGYLKKSNQFNKGSMNDLYSFRPVDNLKKGNKTKTNLNNGNQKLTNPQQSPLRINRQEEDNSYQQRNLKQQPTKKEKEESLRNSQSFKQRDSTINQQDQWLIERLNKKIHDDNYLNSMIKMKPSPITSPKQSDYFMSSYGQNLNKLQKLQQQRFISEKQAQFRANPLGEALSDRALKQKLTGFKSWLKHQSITNLSSDRNNLHETSNFKRLPKFRFFNTEKDLNQFGDHVDMRFGNHIDRYGDNMDRNQNKGYVCYSQSQLQSLTDLYGKGMKMKQDKRTLSKSKSKSKQRQRYLTDNNMNQRQNKKGESQYRLFKKKPQLIITQTTANKKIDRKTRNKSKSKDYRNQKHSCCHSKSLSRSKSNKRNHYKLQRQRQKMMKIKQIEKIYSPKHHNKSKSKSKSKQKSKLNSYNNKREKSNNNNNNKNKLTDYLPKDTNKHNKQRQSIDFDNQTVDENRINNHLLKRVKSSPYMISEIPFSREKQDYRQLVERYKLDERRMKQVKQEILEHKLHQHQQQQQQFYHTHSGTY